MSTNSEARAWLRVRADALRANYARLRAAIGPDAGVLPLVKADAYGLGLAETIRALRSEEPWGWGVATVAEGLDVRALGVEGRVVVLSPDLPASVRPALEAGLQMSVSSLGALDDIVAAGRDLGVTPEIHVEVDTGMGRAGFDWRTAGAWLPQVERAALADVEWAGCFTHLHSADLGDDSVHEQWGRFQRALSLLAVPRDDMVVHVLNSAGTLRSPGYAGRLVRPGIFLYGGSAGADLPAPEPVASLHARVVHVRAAPPGTTLGYGSTYRSKGPERWATLSIGYGDGLPRALGNRGTALLAGARAPIIGRISMDTTVVDISDAPEVAVGDVATLLGSQGQESITVDDVAELAGTISYEVLVGLTRRLPRIWTGLDGS